MGSSNSKKCNEENCNKIYSNNNEILVKSIDEYDSNTIKYRTIKMTVGQNYKIYSPTNNGKFDFLKEGKLTNITYNKPSTLVFNITKTGDANAQSIKDINPSSKNENSMNNYTINLQDTNKYRIDEYPYEVSLGGKRKSKRNKIKRLKNTKNDKK